MLGWREITALVTILGVLVAVMEFRMSALDKRLNDRMSQYYHEQAMISDRIQRLEQR